KKEFTVERQGKTFVLYAGLLDLAHESGLTRIDTDLLQVPTAENGMTAICRATVWITDEDDEERTFTGYGDAAPNNVGPGMQTCLIRMAETRAKARALRDAVNIGVTAFEELEEGALPEATAPPRREAAQRVNASGPVTAAQIDALHSIATRLGLQMDEASAKKFGL